MLKLVTALAFCLVARVCAAQWNVVDDFSTLQNPNGQWQYGYYQLYGGLGLDLPSGEQPFAVLTSSYSGANPSWSMLPEQASLSIIHLDGQNSLNLVAGFAPGFAFYAPVVRWTAPSATEYVLNAAFTYSGSGAAHTPFSEVGIRLNDHTKSFAHIGGTDDSLSASMKLALNAGDTLDFFVARDQHAISLAVDIAPVPEPTSSLLFLTGLLTIAAPRLRRNLKASL